MKIFGLRKTLLVGLLASSSLISRCRLQAEDCRPMEEKRETPVAVLSSISCLVTAAQYCDFLNRVAATDPHHLYDEKMAADPEAACILRSGEPGKLHYEVIAGRENFLINYVNRLQAGISCADRLKAGGYRLEEEQGYTDNLSGGSLQLIDYRLQEEASFAGRLGKMNSEISSSATSTSNFNSHIEDVRSNNNFLEIEVPSMMLTLAGVSSPTSTSNFNSHIQDVSIEQVGAVVGILGLAAFGHELMMEPGDTAAGRAPQAGKPEPQNELGTKKIIDPLNQKVDNDKDRFRDREEISTEMTPTQSLSLDSSNSKQVVDEFSLNAPFARMKIAWDFFSQAAQAFKEDPNDKTLKAAADAALHAANAAAHYAADAARYARDAGYDDGYAARDAGYAARAARYARYAANADAADFAHYAADAATYAADAATYAAYAPTYDANARRFAKAAREAADFAQAVYDWRFGGKPSASSSMTLETRKEERLDQTGYMPIPTDAAYYQEKFKAPKAEVKDARSETFYSNETLSNWQNLTSSQKKAAVIDLITNAERLEQGGLNAEKKAAAASADKRIPLWDRAIQQLENAKVAWEEALEAYTSSKDNPPYWIKARWRAELEHAENRVNLLTAKILFCHAKNAETLTYNSNWFEIKKLERYEEEDTQAINHPEAASLLGEVISKANHATKLWDRVEKTYQEGLAQAPNSLRNEWNQELRKAEKEKTHWSQETSYYQKQKREVQRRKGEPLNSDVTEEPVSKSRVPLQPSPLDHLSDREKLSYPGGSVIDYREFSHPELNQKTYVRVLKTDFAYPYVRLEEVVDNNTVLSRKEVVADHLLVTLEAKTQEAENAFLEKLNINGTSLEKLYSDKPLYRLHFRPNAFNLLLKRASLIDLWEQIFQKIQNEMPETNPRPDGIFHGSATPKDLYYALNNGDRNYNDGQWSLWDSNGINAPEAWDIETSAENVVVAVFDSGINYRHEDLRGNMWVDPNFSTTSATNPCVHPHGINFLPEKIFKKKNDIMDYHGHGTHCAGIIGAVGNNGVGISGVAWKVQLMACKILDYKGKATQGIDSDFAQSIYYAVHNGARILNCSFGGRVDFDPSNYQELVDALQRSYASEAVVVVAAGNAEPAAGGTEPNLNNNDSNDSNSSDDNDPRNNDKHGYYPAKFASVPNIQNIVVVAASQRSSPKLADFSHYGKTTVHLAAPGQDILSAGTFSKIGNFLKVNKDTSYCFSSGTSMAAPHVTGALALMRAIYPGCTAKKLIEIITNASHPVPELASRCISGGRLNLANALKAAKSLRESELHIPNFPPILIPSPLAQNILIFYDQVDNEEDTNSSSLVAKYKIDPKEDARNPDYWNEDLNDDS
ncbi:MAG: S8 family peptidase [Chthoniobacterales bacterium]